MKKTLLLAASLLLSSCATAPEPKFWSPVKSDITMAPDLEQCKFEAEKVKAGLDVRWVNTTETYDRILRQCMKARGYNIYNAG